MAKKKAEEAEEGDGILVCGSDGTLYFVGKRLDQVPTPVKMSEECKKAWVTFCRCLKVDYLVLSRVMKANSKPLSSKRVSRGSAKKRS
jgi:hypothetical protein